MIPPLLYTSVDYVINRTIKYEETTVKIRDCAAAVKAGILYPDKYHLYLFCIMQTASHSIAYKFIR